MFAGKFEEKVETDSWLVVEPTHLEKYATVKNGFIFPKFRGENSKNMEETTTHEDRPCYGLQNFADFHELIK